MTVARIASLEVQRGTRLWRGVAIGASVGALLFAQASHVAKGLCDSPGCGAPVLAYIVSGAVFGGLWGGMIGSQGVVWGPP